MKIRKTSSTVRRGFTLIELLLVIAIIAVMASMALAVVSGAQGEALKAATVSRIRQIESLLSQRMEEYQVRKIDLDITQFTENPVLIRHIRNMILADFIKVEMPRHPDDVQKYPSDGFRIGLEEFDTENWVNGDNDFLPTSRDDLVIALEFNLRFTPALMTKFRDSNFDLQAEFLYEVLAATDLGGGTGVELLGNRAFADSDGDGLLEVVDAWGDPLTFVMQQVEAVNGTGADANVIFEDQYWATASDNATQDFGVARIGDRTMWPCFIPLDSSIPRPIELIRPVVGSVNID